MKTKKAIALSLFLVGTLLICSTLPGIAVAEDVTVDVDVPLSGTMTFQSQDQSGTSHATAPFTANFDETVTVGGDTTNSDAIEAGVQTNSSSWTLTQDISNNELLNAAESRSIHLQWDDPTRGGGYANMDTAGEAVGTGNAPTAGTNYQVDYRVQVGWTDPDGVYQGTVAYTFTPN
jgi:hypothetical protein